MKREELVETRKARIKLNEYRKHKKANSVGEGKYIVIFFNRDPVPGLVQDLQHIPLKYLL